MMANLVKAKRQLIEIAKKVIANGRRVKTQIGTLREKPSRVNRLARQLHGWLKSTERIVEHTEAVLKGRISIRRRVVSIFDISARPIRQGKARADTEFGRKVLIGESGHGIITTHKVFEENPADAALLKTGVRGHRRLFRKRLKAVATDRGFYSQANEEWLHKGGVKQVSILLRGKTSKQRRLEQKQPWLIRLQRFGAGSEGRISFLKRVFGLDRSLMRGNRGTQIMGWAGDICS